MTTSSAATKTISDQSTMTMTLIVTCTECSGLGFVYDSILLREKQCDACKGDGYRGGTSILAASSNPAANDYHFSYLP